MQLPDDPFIRATRELLRLETDKDLEFVFSPEAAAFNDFYVRSLNYHLAMTPWIEAVFPLKNARVLEIGFGGGAATFPVAHKCAHIDAYDIDANALDRVAAKAGVYGLSNINFFVLDPDWARDANIDRFISEIGGEYDLVLLPAVLEHMLIEERLAALRGLWRLLRPNGALVVYDTPNRLYPFDFHSFRLPFFDWIPDEIAIRYAQKSSRSELREILDDAPRKDHTLYRIGRGVSYHEFDLAIGLNECEVINDGYSAYITHRKRNTIYEGLLAGALEEFAPHVPPGFAKAFLELVLRKKWNRVEIKARNGVVDDVRPFYRTPYLRMEGADAFLVVDTGAPRRGRSLVLEIWRHAWSGVLVCQDEQGNEFYSEDLYSSYQREIRVRAPIPDACQNVRLALRPSTAANGLQAWLLGFGVA